MYTHCTRCNRPLKNSTAMKIGMGKICQSKSQMSLDMQADKNTLPFKGDIIIRRTEKGVETNVPHEWVYHSPTGFEIGFGGSGPADLALNILLLFTGNRDTAWKLHQDFKWKFIAAMDKSGGVIKKEEIEKYLDNQLVF